MSKPDDVKTNGHSVPETKPVPKARAASAVAKPTAKPAVKAAAKPAVKAAAKPAAKAVAKPAAKAPVKAVAAKPAAKVAKPAIKAAAKPAKPVKPAKAAKPAAKPAAPAAEQGRDKARKAKLVRDSFTMPEQEYALLGQVKKACLKAGFEIKKSELLRIGVALTSQLDMATLQKVLADLPQLKTGRPKND